MQSSTNNSNRKGTRQHVYQSASTSSSPANTQHSDPGPTPSILEDVISGLIEPRSDAPGEYKPTLIANRPGGLTMREEIGNSLATSDSFDISVAFVSAEAVLSLFEDFRSHHETATRAGTLITSTKNHFNDPRAFWELLHLQNTTGVDVRVWEGSRNAQWPQWLKDSHSIQRDISFLAA